MMEFPLPFNDQKIIEQTGFQKIKSLQFIGGLPIYVGARDVTINKPTEAEMWIENITGSMYLCSYIIGLKHRWREI